MLNMTLLHHLLQEAQAVYARTSTAPTSTQLASCKEVSNTSDITRQDFVGTICGQSVK